ncbi:MAG: hypothetical protein ABDH37_06460 [Candidatus Hydrothermales bacterium]
MVNKYFLLYLFLLKFCINSVNLPSDFDINLVIFLDLMPSPIQHPRNIKGILEIKGSFQKDPQLKEIKILFDDFELKVPFTKNKENVYIFKIPLSPINVEKFEKNLKFKITLAYKRKIFEIIKDKVEIKKVY